MNSTISILRRAQKELGELPTEAYVRVRNSILGLAQNPRPSGCVKLNNREGWRIRVGDYRVIYEIDDSKELLLSSPLVIDVMFTAR